MDHSGTKSTAQLLNVITPLKLIYLLAGMCLKTTDLVVYFDEDLHLFVQWV